MHPRTAQLGQQGGIAQRTRHAGQGLQVLVRCRQRNQEQKHQVYRLVIDRIEVQRVFQTGEDAKGLVESREPGVGNSHPPPIPLEPNASLARILS
ncbi:hypothetical protein FHS63_003673 [Azospirillum doebereinerae]|nr:hypothetical protein [Azospirillum doebereinerae]MCG5239406.1 hypothetical protein [Azospirillum doebereinerae]